jgi:hypothetical protein
MIVHKQTPIRRLILTIGIVISTMAATSSASLVKAANINFISSDVITIEGSIELGDCAPGMKSVLLNSTGGLDGQGECISRSIAALSLKTVVRQRCNSICFLLFAAGIERSAALVGVHRPYNVKTHEEGSDPQFLRVILEYADRYRVPQAIKEKLSGTSSRNIYYLTKTDLDSMNVNGCC